MAVSTMPSISSIGSLRGAVGARSFRHNSSDASSPAGERQPVDFLDLTLSEVAADVALDEALLLDAEAGRAGEVLRLWERPAPAVVLGSGCKLHEDVDVAACEADGVPLVRRSSGGGTVLLAE